MRRIPRWLMFTAIVVVLALARRPASRSARCGGRSRRLDGRGRRAGPRGPGRGAARRVRGARRSTPTTPRICSRPRASCTPRTGSTRWTSGVTSPPGRLSELYGDSQVETDTYIRTLGWRRVAEQELALLSAVDPALPGRVRRRGQRLPAAAGRRRTCPLEYSLLALQGLDYTPERVDGGGLGGLAEGDGLGLGSNMDDEVETGRIVTAGRRRPGGRPVPGLSDGRLRADRQSRGRRRKGLRPERAAGLRPPAARRRSAADQLRGRRRCSLTVAERDREPRCPPLLGDGRQAETGLELLGRGGSADRERPADPGQRSAPGHLDPVGLRPGRAALPDGDPDAARSTSPASASPACPGVVIGKNTKIAWGLTTSYVDVQDLYLEQVRGDTVRVGDNYVPLQVTHRGDPGARRGRAAEDHGSGRPGTVRCCPMSDASTAAGRGGPRRARATGRVRGRAELGGPHPGPDHGRGARPRPGARLRPVPQAAALLARRRRT